MVTLAARPAADLRRLASRALAPVVRVAARAYVAGPHLGDALELRSQLARNGIGCTLGYFDAGEAPWQVARRCLDALSELQGSEDYLSIKPPALQFHAGVLDSLGAAAARTGTLLHADAHGPDTAEATHDALLRLQHAGAPCVGVTLPGRWARSVADAELLAPRCWHVRVVKGQWADPSDPRRDARQGFLDVIDALAGRATAVTVATHDARLAEDALRRLRAHGTPCRLELLYGLPSRAALACAARLRVRVRFYIPFGVGHLPYMLERALREPWLLGRLARDGLASLCRPAWRVPRGGTRAAGPGA